MSKRKQDEYDDYSKRKRYDDRRSYDRRDYDRNDRRDYPRDDRKDYDRREERRDYKYNDKKDYKRETRDSDLKNNFKKSEEKIPEVKKDEKVSKSNTLSSKQEHILTLTQEEKKQKLEAWKKKMEEQKILEKLKEEVKKKEETQPTEVNEEDKVKIKFGNVKKEVEVQKSFTFEDDEPVTSNAIKKEEVSEDIDSLDAYMLSINDQVQKLEKKQEKKVWTWEDVESLEQQTGNEPIDEEEYHKIFKEALKNTNQKEPEILNNNEDSEGYLLDSYMTIPENEFEEEVGLKKAKAKKELKEVDHSKMDYLPIRKNFYIPPKELANLTQEDIEVKRKDMENIQVSGKDIPCPVSTWEQCGLNDSILKLLEEMNFKEPFSIQSQAIPAIMSGKDVIGIAKTGSGKTLAYLLPLFRHILDQTAKYPLIEGEDGPIGLILAPTRELAVQIDGELKKFTKFLKLRSLCAYGGGNISDQIAVCKTAPHIIVCTPGRMIDLLCANKGKVTNLTRCSFVVLDEADRQFDQGFMPQIMKIIGNIRPDKQMVMFSATFPKPLEALAKKALKDPISIIVGGRSIACDNVRQFIEVRSEESKFLRLLELLGIWNEKGNILIFVEKQIDADQLFKDLLSSGYDPLLLHGGMEQMERTHTISQFKKREKNIMVATGVAARGLDVKGLKLVVNYTCPYYREDYVHRIGRTGRAKKKGTAYTFILPTEEHLAPELLKALKQSKSEISPELEEMAKNYLQKKKKGLTDVKVIRGYSGSGFKFTEKEMNKKQEEIHMQKQMIKSEEDDQEDKPIPTPKPQSDPLSSIEHAKKYAELLTIKNTIATEDTKGHYTAEIEINDFPQSVRAKLTQKDTLFEISELTNTSIFCKGSFVPNGVKIPLGERKLYLLIESKTLEALERGKQQVNHMLKEASRDAEPEAQSRGIIGKYNVL